MFMKKNNDSDSVLHALCNDIKRTPLVLFVGAGVNAGIAPQWGELLRRLLRRAINNFIDSDTGVIDYNEVDQKVQYIMEKT